MDTPLTPIIEMLFAVISRHPKASLAVFLLIFSGPLIMWMRSGARGRHRR